MEGNASSLYQLFAVLVAGYILGRVHAFWRDPKLREQRRKQKLADERTVEERLRSLSPDVRANVDRLMAEGKKIEAIRDLRLATGWGLKESKDVVELADHQSSRGARVG
jgi:hypothetical protein